LDQRRLARMPSEYQVASKDARAGAKVLTRGDRTKRVCRHARELAVDQDRFRVARAAVGSGGFLSGAFLWHGLG